MNKPKYNLSARLALIEMRKQLRKMRAETDRQQLKDMSPDDAYEAGYESAITDLDVLSGRDPKTIHNDAAGRMARGELNDD